MIQHEVMREAEHDASVAKAMRAWFVLREYMACDVYGLRVRQLSKNIGIALRNDNAKVKRDARLQLTDCMRRPNNTIAVAKR